MDQDIQKRLDSLEAKVDAIFKSVEKSRRYFLILMWISILAVVVPAFGLIFAIPSFLNTYVGSLNGLM